MPNLAQKRDSYEDFWRFSHNCWSPYLAAAQNDLYIFNGDAWDSKEKAYLKSQGRNILNLNKIRPTLNFYDGFFRDTMTSVAVMPVENSDQQTADDLSEVMYYVYDKANADHVISEAVFHSFKVGISLIGIYMDYNDDPVNGTIRFFWKPYNSFLLDPFFRDRSLSDASQALLRSYVTPVQAKSLLPFVDEKDISDLVTAEFDNKFLSLPERNKRLFDTQDLLTYDQYYTRTTRKQELIVDIRTGETREVPDDEEMRERVRQVASQSRDVDIIEREIDTIELNVFLGGQAVYSGPDPTKLDDFPFVAAVTYYDPDLDDYSIKLQGITRGMVDGQREFNKRHSKIIDVFDKALYSGFFYKPDMLVDKEAVFQSGQGAHIPLKKEAVIGQDISPTPNVSLPTGMLEYGQILNSLIPELAGVNEDMVGTSEGGNNLISGALSQIRASNGLRSNRGVFDNMEYTQKMLANKVLTAIQRNMSPEKVERIIGRRPTDQFFNQSFERFDAQIVQTVKSQNQRQQFYLDLLQAKQLGVEIDDDLIIEAMPMQRKGVLLERMQEKEQQKQLAQQKLMEQEELSNKTQNAKIMSDIALATERIARAEADTGLAKERISELQQNNAAAVLDRIKAAKEFQELDIGNAIKSLQFIQQLNELEVAKGEAIDDESEAQSEQTFSGLMQAVEQQSQPQAEQQQPQQPGGI